MLIRCLAAAVVALLGLAGVAGAWTPESCVLGPGDGVSGGPPSDNLSTNGQDAADTWKAFRWQAGRSGDIYLFAVMVQSIPGSVADEDLTCAVYDDNAGAIGALKVWGRRLGYNWHTIGVGRHFFDLGNVVTNRTVTAGRNYWVAFRTSTDNNGRLYWERQGGGDPLPAWIGKKGVTVSGGYDQTPPSGSTYDIAYNPNYYGWSAWTATDGAAVPDTTPPTGSVLVNGQDARTRDVDVTLTLSATDTESGVTEMCVGNASGATCPGAWEAYRTTRPWVLSAGEGVRTVYVWFRDGSGNVSAPHSDAITLDATPPDPPTIR